jgi:hypothetical protein
VAFRAYVKNVAVLGKGVEPSIPLGRWFLRPVCMPVPPSQQVVAVVGFEPT